MGFRSFILAGALTVLLAACGSSSKPSTSANSGGPLPPIAHRLLTSSEMPPGFSAHGQPSVSTSVRAWLQSSQTPPARLRAQTERLNRLGFVAAASQSLTSSKGPGLSLVEQFRAPSGAHSEFAGEVKAFKSALGVKEFPVSGIPAAFGFGVNGGGANVVFADGAYYYVVGAAVPPTRANQLAVVASAQKLFHRVHA